MGLQDQPNAMRMKKSLILILLAFSTLGASTMYAEPISSPICAPSQQNYCPDGYVCEATNCTAEYWDNSKGKWNKISGVAIYKNDQGDVIAYIPGHGNLRAYKVQNKAYGFHWAVDINGTQYSISGYNRE